MFDAGIYAVAVPRSRTACGLIVVLAGGWWVGYALLTGLLGLRMTPPRSNNWSGCVGLFTALLDLPGTPKLLCEGGHGTPEPHTEQQLSPSDSYWKVGMKYWLIWLVIPIVIL